MARGVTGMDPGTGNSSIQRRVGSANDAGMKRKTYNWTLPPEIESRLGETTYGRQRAIAGGGHLLVILHAPPVPDVHEREAVLLLRRPEGQLLVNGFEGGELKVRKLLADYRGRLDALDDRTEGAQRADEIFAVLEELGPLQRSMAHLADALQSARDLAKGDKALISLRDEAYEISRGFDLLLSEARLKMDYRIARNSELNQEQSARQAAAQHKLNVLAAFALPLTAMATLLGMNVQHGLEGRPPGFFWMVLAMGTAVGFAVRGWVTR